MRTVSAASVALLLCVGCTREPQETDSGTPPTLRPFVQSFYDWYVPITRRPERAFETAIAQRAASFDSSLVRALAEDARAQRADTTGSIVGLDYDPFLASQDPCERYEARSISRDGPQFRVGIHAVCGAETLSTPDVVAVLEERSGSWVFVDFLYAGRNALPSHSLTHTLQELRRSRECP